MTGNLLFFLVRFIQQTVRNMPTITSTWSPIIIGLQGWKDVSFASQFLAFD